MPVVFLLFFFIKDFSFQNKNPIMKKKIIKKIKYVSGQILVIAFKNIQIIEKFTRSGIDCGLNTLI